MRHDFPGELQADTGKLVTTVREADQTAGITLGCLPFHPPELVPLEALSHSLKQTVAADLAAGLFDPPPANTRRPETVLDPTP